MKRIRKIRKKTFFRWLTYDVNTQQHFIELNNERSGIKSIPLGRKNDKLYFKAINNISVNRVYNYKRLFLGFLALILMSSIALFAGFQPNLTLEIKAALIVPIVLIALITFEYIASFRRVRLTIDVNGNSKHYLFAYSEKNKIQLVEQRIKNQIQQYDTQYGLVPYMTDLSGQISRRQSAKKRKRRSRRQNKNQSI